MPVTCETLMDYLISIHIRCIFLLCGEIIYDSISQLIARQPSLNDFNPDKKKDILTSASQMWGFADVKRIVRYHLIMLCVILYYLNACICLA